MNDALFGRQVYKMVRSRNFQEFRAALATLDQRMFNLVYADREGNIFYLYNGIVPRRDRKLDWSKAVDGRRPESDWQRNFVARGIAAGPQSDFGLRPELQSVAVHDDR